MPTTAAIPIASSFSDQNATPHTPPASFPSSLPSPVVSSPAAAFLSVFSPPQAVSLDSEREIGGYILGPVIGYGGFSTIHQAQSNDGGIVAVKIVRRTDLLKQTNPTLARKRLDNETSVWTSLSHEHILPLFSSVHTANADYFFTLFCPSGSLFDILGRDGRPGLPQDDVGRIFRQIVAGLRYMHEVAGLVHRDIKLENVLVDEMGTCRITDFGMTVHIGEVDDNDDGPTVQRSATFASKPRLKKSSLAGLMSHPSMARHGFRHRNYTNTETDSKSHHYCQPGSLPYASPEIITSRSPHPAHPAQDVWALGILLHTLLAGKLPFSDSFEPRLQIKILHTPYELPPNIDDGPSRILKGCLDKNVDTRWTIAMVDDDVTWNAGWCAPEQEEHTPHQRSRSRVAVPSLERTPSSAPSSRSRGRSRMSRLNKSRSPSMPKTPSDQFPGVEELDLDINMHAWPEKRDEFDAGVAVVIREVGRDRGRSFPRGRRLAGRSRSVEVKK